jgi:general secretion pathway protein E
MSTPAHKVPAVERVLHQGDFNLAFVINALVRVNALTEEQKREIILKEGAQRALIAKERGGSESARYQVSPVEIIASLGLPLIGKPGRMLDEELVTEVAARAARVPYRKIDPLKLDMALITRSLSRPFASRHAVLPIERTPEGLVVAVANPFDREVFENLRGILNSKIVPVLSAKIDILQAIEHVYGFRSSVAAAIDQAEDGREISDFEQLVRLSGDRELDVNDKPVVAAVEYLLKYAFDQRASDIHVEPRREQSLIRLRIDGVLHPVYTVPRPVHAPITARIKNLARMDIAEKRRPQDGRIKTDRNGREIEIRVSTIPAAFGEKVVLRIFDPEAAIQDLAQVGFEADELAMFQSWIDRPHGLILVTGPTGSGKTTTLYSALKALAGPDVNVTTIEDPIEMVYEGFNQIQVQPKIDLDFAAALRHILRQDPDIIMVGEIRDEETAASAIQCALTGHLVFSTVHTNNALDAVTRLRDLKVPSFLVGSSLVGLMAQRLVRVICPHCSQEASLTADQVAGLGVPIPLIGGGVQVRHGAGCQRCRNTGFRGRTGVFEMVDCTLEIRSMIIGGREPPDIQNAARKNGMRILRESAVRKLAMGVTTYDEVMRVTAL